MYNQCTQFFGVFWLNITQIRVYRLYTHRSNFFVEWEERWNLVPRQQLCRKNVWCWICKKIGERIRRNMDKG